MHKQLNMLEYQSIWSIWAVLPHLPHLHILSTYITNSRSDTTLILQSLQFIAAIMEGLYNKQFNQLVLQHRKKSLTNHFLPVPDCPRQLSFTKIQTRATQHSHTQHSQTRVKMPKTIKINYRKKESTLPTMHVKQLSSLSLEQALGVNQFSIRSQYEQAIKSTHNPELQESLQLELNPSRNGSKEIKKSLRISIQKKKQQQDIAMQGIKLGSGNYQHHIRQPLNIWRSRKHTEKKYAKSPNMRFKQAFHSTKRLTGWDE